MEDNRQLRQAAILIASLDQATADALLDQLAPAEADRVRRMLVSLDEIDSSEQEAVIGHFLGVDEPDDPEQVISQPEDPPFEFLREACANQLLPLLEHEHPQTVAVVVAHLPRSRAAEVLNSLADPLQADVMRRLADLDEMDVEILREVERGLKDRIVRQVRTQRRHNALAEILEAADQHTLPQPLPPPTPMEFDDLQRLSGAELRRLLAAADRETTVLALAGACPSFVDRILSELPTSEAESLQLAWRQLGPTPLSDIEAAQHELAALANPLDF